MSLIKKVDVEKRLAARRRAIVFPFAPVVKELTAEETKGARRKTKAEAAKPSSPSADRMHSFSQPSRPAIQLNGHPVTALETEKVGKPQA